MTRIARILHISDLHFVKELTQEGRAFSRLRAQSHSFYKIEHLAAHIREMENVQGPFDLVLATGDLSTNGLCGSLATVLEYLDKDTLYRGSPARLMTKGLRAGEGRRLLLPGNHDRFTRDWIPIQRQSDKFEKVLKTPNRYPYVVGFRPRGLADARNIPALLFFVFDSTPSVAARMWPAKRIARGRIENEECRWIVDTALALRENGRVESIDGTPIRIDFDNCVRIAVLHHHPFDEGFTSLMENNAKFVEYCFRGGIDVVLFGHDHKEFYKARFSDQPLDVPSTGSPIHWITFLCCPSASEYSSDNGFYTLDVSDTGYTFQLYKWQQSQFVGDDPVSVRFSR